MELGLVHDLPALCAGEVSPDQRVLKILYRKPGAEAEEKGIFSRAETRKEKGIK